MEATNEQNEISRKSDTSRAMGGNAINVDSPPNRRPLGDLSPNVKLASSAPSFLKRPIGESPLKRSFTAAMEGGDGFKYLKRRKLDDSETLSDLIGERGIGAPQHMEELQPDTTVPEIQEPTPTEPNTPSDEQDDSSGSSAERKSFSSLINYDQSSQTSNLLFKTSNAEILRLRLRVAMYKVQTNQIGIPFTELHVEDQSPQAKAQRAADAAVEELRQEAREVAARQPPQPVPKLLPAPVLLPTAYSSRMIYETLLPSTPPAFLSSGKLPTAAAAESPLREVQKVESPPTSVQSPRRTLDMELTSSAVKGRAAEELLGLRHAI